MSALGQILAAVEQKVSELLSSFTSKQEEQDQEIQDLERRVQDLENAQAKPASSSRQTVAAKARGAKAGE